MTTKYVKKDQITHILDRPDMYCGSHKLRLSEEYVSENTSQMFFQITKKNIEISPAICRIFIEPLSNIIDNVARSKKTDNPVTRIDINISPETGLVSFKNDGEVISIQMHSEGYYNHTLVFGHLLTSSNYDDTEDRVDISGRNGIGVKLSNVFSEVFTVEGVDPVNKKSFYQQWKNNMREASEPVIKKVKSTDVGYTKISFIPDFKRFGITKFSKDMIDLFRKYVVDCAMITKVDVYFNSVPITIKSLYDYALLYLPVDTETETEKEILYVNSSDCQVVLTASDEYECISFVNGVHTPLGGTHVDAWSNAFFKPILEKLNKADKPVLNIKDVKNCFKLFIVASVSNPRFDSQSKTKLEEPTITATVKPSDIKKIQKWSVITRLTDIIQAKELISLKKIERKKKGFVKIENLSSANNEGGKFAQQCTLIIVEGKSAKTYAMKGIGFGVYDRKGPDWFGVYSILGKLMNCRKAKPSAIAKNKEIVDIIKALGLQIDLDYSIDDNFKTLRYGKVMILTDQDVDGLHISGLIQNMFHSLFPSLLKRPEPFIISMQTPIVKLSMGKNDVLFYDEYQFKKYVETMSKKPDTKDVKYFKGLGTMNDNMIGTTFGVKMIEFMEDADTDKSMNKIFHKDFTNERKNWMVNYNPETIQIVWDKDNTEVKKISMSQFLNNEVVKFSLEDCKRSIPSIFDGLKESQRKIVYVAFKRKLTHDKKTIKVAQFGATVAEQSAYHHGEQNLYINLIKLAQSFVGSNNIPLFYKDGQFGSRNDGGKDYASPRYIFTKLEKLTRIMFNPEDDDILERNYDDEQIVEPKHYIPIVPLLLINGCVGIGTGWSTKIPSYNPLVLVEAVKLWIDRKGDVFYHEKGIKKTHFPDLVPWYNGFNGTITRSEDKFITRGTYTRDGNKVIVTELPIGLWTDDFKNFLDDLKQDKKIKDYKRYGTPDTVHFEIMETNDGISCNEKTLKLTTTLSTTNIVVFNKNNLIQKFDTVYDLLNEYCSERFNFYVIRKKHYLKKLEYEILILKNRKRFLEEIINGTLEVFKMEGNKRVSKSNNEISLELNDRQYYKNEDETSTDSDAINKPYDYLLNMQIKSMTNERIVKMTNEIANLERTRDDILNLYEGDLWKRELNDFVKEYTEYLKTSTVNNLDKPKPKRK